MVRPGLIQTPVRLCCGRAHWGPVCPDGMVMCTICFGRWTTDELYIDAAGVTWDLCKGCGEQVGEE